MKSKYLPLLRGLMDRQSLLEQKRQRLQELKKRRQIVIDNDKNSVDSIIKDLESSRKENKLIDVGVQVDSIDRERSSYVKPTKEKEYVMFDKAIQVDMPLIDENTHEVKIEIDKDNDNINDNDNDNDANNTSGIRRVTNIPEDELNENIKETLKLVNKLIIEESLDISSISDYKVAYTENNDSSSDLKNPTKRMLNIVPIGNRLIEYIDVSPLFKELVVVAYSSENKLSKESPGFAIIYNISGNKEFPEYFLKCTSPIKVIKFDIHNLNKLYGGLEDGRVVLWDLTFTKSTSTAILPHLSSPILKMYHTMGVSCINQVTVDGNDCLVTSSLDGTLNLWSTNFLLSPKIKPVKVITEESSRDIRIFDTMLSEDLRYKSSESSSFEYSFLNRIVITCNGGLILQLQNDKKLVKQILQDKTPKYHTSMITSMHFLESNLIIASCLDWYIKIWSLDESLPLLKIPTKFPIISMRKRPCKQLQFAIIGNCGDSYIQLWDLNYRLMNPVLEIVLEEIPSEVNFDISGKQMLIGFDSGRIMTWVINDQLLEEKISSETNLRVDSGIDRLLLVKLSQ